MNKPGHYVTSLAFAATISTAMIAGRIIPPYDVETYLVALFWSSGIMSGASAPDWLELAVHNKRDGRLIRKSLIPHRTLTHWPILWLGAGYWVWNLNLPWFAESFALGFVASGLMHIAMDAFSKAGIPLLLPMARYRVRIPLYTTGGVSEFFMASLVVALFSVLAFAAGQGIAL